MSSALEDIFGPPISVYSRAQAIEDGELVDISEWAREDGFKFPVAMTRALFLTCHPDEGDHEDQRGRVHDVLFLLSVAAKRGGDRIVYPCKIGRRVYQIVAVCGPDDDMAPCITLMLPEDE